MTAMANAKPTPSAQAESVYTAAELAASAKDCFGTTPEVVTAALQLEGITATTERQARTIVRAFLTKEVK